MGGRTRRRAYSHWDYRGRPKVSYTNPSRALAAARRLAAQHGWSQVAVEAIALPDDVRARVSQVAVEVLRQRTVVPSPPRVQALAIG